MGKLYFTYSAMNAGKSAILLQAAYNYRERGMEVMLWTSGHHGNDDADVGEISSRIGLREQAHLFRLDTDLYQRIEREKQKTGASAVFVDEAQFLTTNQVWQLAQVGDRLNLAGPVLWASNRLQGRFVRRGCHFARDCR